MQQCDLSVRGEMFSDGGGEVTFKIFDKRRQHCDLKPAISINRYGKFAFNKPASDFLKEHGFKTVVLMYDSEQKKIGIRKPIGYDEAEYRLSDSQEKFYLVFSSQAFLKFIEYPLTQTKSFPLEWDNDIKAYIVNLPFLEADK